MAYWHWPKGLVKKSSFKQVWVYSCVVSQIPCSNRGCRGTVLSIWETLEKRYRLGKDLQVLAWQCWADQDSLPFGWGVAGDRKGNHNSHSDLQGALGVWTEVSITIKCLAYYVPILCFLSIGVQKSTWYLIVHKDLISCWTGNIHTQPISGKKITVIMS